MGGPWAGWLLWRRQAGLRATAGVLAAAVEQSRSAVMIFNGQGVIAHVNGGFCRLVGRERRELVGRPWRDFPVTDPGTPPQLTAELTAALQDHRAWEGEWQRRHPDGTTRPVRALFTPLPAGRGRAPGFVAAFDDLSEARRTEVVLREAQVRAEAGEEAKSYFLTTISHEMRTPLNGILGFTSLLLDTPLTADQRELVETIQLSGSALIQLTDGILDFARIESGKLKLDPLPCAPRECVEDALDLVAARAGAKGLELLHWVDDSVPAVILAEGNRLRQVLTNLLNNAVKFTASGSVSVSMRRIPQEHDAPRMRFEIADTGIGLDPARAHHLFQPFVQGDSSSTRTHGGLGLGLAICHHLVNFMQGDIGYSQPLSQGSTFWFEIPLAADALAQA